MPIRRTLKNVVKNYSDAQVKVREATSNDPWGPSSTLMSEIADLTYNVVAFTEIMQMVWKRLNDHGKNWRHVYKSLVLLDYIIKTGSEKVAQQCKENIFAIQTLKDFQYIEDGKDHGINVREKAKQMVQLLKDDDRLKNERAKALKAKERFAQTTMGIGSSGVIKYPTGGGESPTLHSGAGGYSDPYGGATGHQDFQASSPGTDVPEVTRPAIAASEPVAEGNVELEAARPSTAGEEELQLQLALAMSKEEHDEEVKRQKVDSAKLQMAIEESRKEQHTEGPASSTLLDLAIGSSASVPSTLPSDITDPWGDPINEQQPPPPPPPPQTNVWTGSTTVTQNPPSLDPWNPTNSIPKLAPEPAPSNDIWGASGGLESAAPKDPWKVEPSSTASSQSSPWGSPVNRTSHTTTNGAVSSAAPPPGIDDEFDMLSSSRSKSPNTTDANASDLLGGGGTAGSQNTWDLSGMRSGLNEQNQGQGVPKKKSPEDFLGANSDLVNLDDLVSRPTVPGSTNPFAGGSESVFGSSDNQATRNQMPMNQMQSTSVSVGFQQSQQSSSTVLPAPLLPMSTTSQSQFAPMQAQSNNPFL